MTSPNAQVGLGIIGCGVISALHIRESQGDDRLRWVAACDVNAEALQARAEEFDIPGRYGSVDDLLADPAVDAVVVATPPPLHVDPTVAALKAGKHVLVEKPIALNADEIRQMIAAQIDGLVAACCSSRFRSAAAAGRAAEIVASGELGAVRRMACTAINAPPKDLDGTKPIYLYRPNWGALGTLGDWGCYDLDFLLGICGWSLEPKTVLADTRKLQDVYAKDHPPLNDVEVQVSAKVLFDSGATLDYRRANYYAGEPRDEWAIECEDGTIALSMVLKKPPLVVHRYVSSGIETTVEIEEPERWGIIHGGPVLDLVGTIIENRPPRTTLENSLVIQRMTDGIYASAEAGEAVTV